MVGIMRKKLFPKGSPGGGIFLRHGIVHSDHSGLSGLSDSVLGSRRGAAAAVLPRAMPRIDPTDLQDNGLDALTSRIETVIDQGLDLARLQGSFYLGVKRVFDIVISLVALGLFGLILPVLTLIIKLDSPGPVFYSQERVGVNRRRPRYAFPGVDRRKILQPGRPFKVFKLRTMGTNAEVDGPQLARVNDVRITRVGKFLRRSRLDEVPQFLNVLRGEMSLIGPRPERMVFVRQWEKEIPNYRDRLLVLPGITGLAQVINGYDDGVNSVRRKVELDRQYIKMAGFRQDSSILLSTVSVVLKGDGAR
jgi:lipopolysaccharide/colanic/teichoic acid biosynthesis glycosyltransferase